MMSMTDEQIVKALECCSYATSNRDCEQCPYYPDEECVKKQCTDIIDLIKRQQEEIEDLREIIFTDRTEAIKKLKAEAIREFAERLKDVFVTIDGTFECWEIEEHIDELVREMTEQKK